MARIIDVFEFMDETGTKVAARIPEAQGWEHTSFRFGSQVIVQHNQAAVWNQALLQNGAKPSGALVVKGADGSGGHLTDEQFGRLRNQIDEQYAGARNAGRPLLLEGGLELPPGMSLPF